MNTPPRELRFASDAQSEDGKAHGSHDGQILFDEGY
jgi:hypothetical protein